ncbi:TetR/AcrR family transcriptional regulator [Streptomyces sp. V1I1]|uniref:TetR/AcrR family transcriptional regulator n=1 Tax=Streptomyces sp. V1I1 TaxID=3042272 RepID=UPI002780890B|nr:TetR/AcrR family transcriptional regulator [Streptomyces sp. V1I1]MDQ0942316.1 AcrR family transcriptional regulator [Streptomyces sp. V1I1]
MSAQSTPPAPASRSSARTRLVTAAADMFYAEGIHSVGVDRLIAAAGVTKATFYRHFPSKEDLVIEYLRLRDAEIRSQVAHTTAEIPDPREAFAAVVEWLADEVCGAGFRGCPFINAAAEYPDPAHPVRLLITGHRTWFRGAVADLLRAAGHPDPVPAAASLLLLRDGAMVGGYLDGDEVRDTMIRTADELLKDTDD